jgi:hypothetical protein
MKFPERCGDPSNVDQAFSNSWLFTAFHPNVSKISLD